MRALLITMTLLATTTLLAGGGWVKSKGEGYYKINQSWVESMGYFSGGMGYSPQLNSQLFTTSLYAEHGLGDKISLEAYLPIYVRHTIDGMITEDGEDLVITDGQGGFGDVNLGLRTNVLSKDYLCISSTLTLGLPTGKATLGERNNLFTGDGEFNQLIRFDASVPFGTKKIAGYSTIYGAFNNRSGGFSNEFWYGVEAGISSLQSRVWLIGRINAINALNSDSQSEFTNSFTQSMSFTNYMIEAAFYFDKNTGLSVSYTGSIEGNVLLVAPVYSVGLFMDIK